MTVEADRQQQEEERVAGRVWTVRLDPYGRPSAGTVRVHGQDHRAAAPH